LRSKAAKTAGKKFFRSRKRERKCRIGNPPDFYLNGYNPSGYHVPLCRVPEKTKSRQNIILRF
jgi:hypothetical protein